MKKPSASSGNGSSSGHSATDFSDTLMIGDSVMALSRNTIMSLMPNVHIDAVSGRESEIGGPSENYNVNCGIFDKMRNVNPYRYTNYVIGCGNNDYYGIGAAALEGALTKILTNKSARIFLVTEYVTNNRAGSNNTNASIRYLASKYKNIRIIDWASLASRNPGYLMDNVHLLTGSGDIAYAALVRQSIMSYS